MDAKREVAAQIARRVREAGFQAYFVGGCVRDLVMGREPADYDLATDATPQQVLGLFPERLTVGASGRSATRSSGSAKIGCACSAPCVSPRASTLRLTRQRLKPSRNLPRPSLT